MSSCKRDHPIDFGWYWLMLIFSLQAICLCLANDAMAQSPTTKSKHEPQRYALLIGVDDYVNLNDLKYCGNDQTALRDRLVAAGFPKDQVVLIHDSANENRFKPFKASIEQQLLLLLQQVEKDDLVIVGFSGHGVQLESMPYLCPADADLDKPESLISLNNVYEKLRKSPAALRLVIVDACRDDPQRSGTRSARSINELSEFAKSRPPDGILCLSSCGPGQKSNEDSEFKQGVFMHFLLEGFTGVADENKDGVVSLGEVSTHAARMTKKYVAKKFNDFQSPALKGEYELEALDFHLGKTTVPNHEPFRNSIGIDLVYIPPGEFDMGSPEGPDELLRRFSYAKREWVVGEQPVHKVRITKGFYLGKYEVTLGQFLKFYHDAKYKVDAEKDGMGGWGFDPTANKPFGQKPNYRPWSWGFEGQTMDHPVVNVSWNDATAFCRWLSEKEGKSYRLPTEAEWEYACRAGTRTRYWNGDDPEGLVSIDNVWDSTIKGQYPKITFQNNLLSSDGYPFTAPVGHFKPNSFGLYDMHGNVAEWCQDWYEEGYYGKSPAEDPRGASTGSSRVIRGGGWFLYAVFCRAAYRVEDPPTSRNHFIGFRIVCVSE